MIDPKNLKIGDTVYSVVKTLRIPRRKFTFVDSANNEWHRFEDMYDFKINKKTLSGYVVHEVHGVIYPDYENGIGELYFLDGNGKLIDHGYLSDDSHFWSMTFSTEDEAQKFINDQQEKIRLNSD
jgi:hypothetical protein